MPLLHAARFDYAAHDRERTTEALHVAFGGSDPLHYTWAAFSPKTGGRYRPNRDFRPRSFFRLAAVDWAVDEGLEFRV